MTKTDIIYLAGIIDGEGCISLAHRKKKYVTPTLQITNTSRVLIDWLYEQLGGNIYTRKDDRANRRDSWLWSVAGAKAKHIITSVRPYLKVKVAQADVVIGLLRITEIKRNVRGQLVSTLTAEQLRRNAEAVALIRTLNKRGRP